MLYLWDYLGIKLGTETDLMDLETSEVLSSRIHHAGNRVLFLGPILKVDFATVSNRIMVEMSVLKAISLLPFHRRPI